jgi:hypothetical protein
MANGYLEVISLVERLHRYFLEVVKLELDGLQIHDINNVQGLMLFNGRKLRDRLTEMHRRHTEMLSEIMSDDDLQTVTTTLRRLERFWIHTGAPVERPGQYAAGF